MIKSSKPALTTSKNDASAMRLQEFTIPLPLKLSALWASLMSCYIYGDYFSLYVPGEIEGLLKSQNTLDSPVKLLAAAVMLALPALMIYLSLGLRASTSRRFNIVAGILYTIVMLLVGFSSISAWRLFYVFLAIVEISITLLIVYYAVKWPRNEHGA